MFYVCCRDKSLACAFCTTSYSRVFLCAEGSSAGAHLHHRLFNDENLLDFQNKWCASLLLTGHISLYLCQRPLFISWWFHLLFELSLDVSLYSNVMFFSISVICCSNVKPNKPHNIPNKPRYKRASISPNKQTNPGVSEWASYPYQSLIADLA